MFPIEKAYISGHNRPGRKLDALKSIVIHWTANTSKGANAMANRNYFNTKHLKGDGTPIYASAHYLVDSTRIIQALPDDEVGYHVGAKASSYTDTAHRIMGASGSPNYVTIGIEMCVNSDGDFNITRAQTVALTRDLAKRYGVERRNVLRHYDITGKLCPQMMIDAKPWKDFLDDVFGEAYTVLAQPQAFVVNTAALHVRKGPGTEHAKDGSLRMGDEVQGFQQVGEWLRIGEGRFVKLEYLKKKMG